MLPAQPNQSLIDGLACLQALTGGGAAVGVRELARTLGLEPTRVQRLLGTLAHLGLAERTGAGKYLPGPGVHVLAAQSLFASGLLRRALPELAVLHRCRLAVALGVRWRDQVSYLYHADPGMPPGHGIGRVGLYPATQSSIGLMLLATRPAAEVAALYADRGVPAFPGGLAELAPVLRAAAAARHACVWHTTARSIRSVAVPIGDAPVAALAFAGTIAPRRLPALLRALHRAAEAIAVSRA